MFPRGGEVVIRRLENVQQVTIGPLIERRIAKGPNTREAAMRCHLGATPWLIDTSVEGSFSVAIPELSRVQPSSGKFWVLSPAESGVSPCSPRVSKHCFRESPNSRGQMVLGGSVPGSGPIIRDFPDAP